MLTNFYSFGGIIALALGINGWSAQLCSGQFEELVLRAGAFTKRPLRDTAFQWMFKPGSPSNYLTTSLTEALSSWFGGRSLFGPQQSKVAVTATSPKLRTHILANYGREDNSGTIPAPPYLNLFLQRIRCAITPISE